MEFSFQAGVSNIHIGVEDPVFEVDEAFGKVLENLARDLIKPTLSRAELCLFELGRLQYI